MRRLRGMSARRVLVLGAALWCATSVHLAGEHCGAASAPHTPVKRKRLAHTQVAGNIPEGARVQQVIVWDMTSSWPSGHEEFLTLKLLLGTKEPILSVARWYVRRYCGLARPWDRVRAFRKDTYDGDFYGYGRDPVKLFQTNGAHLVKARLILLPRKKKLPLPAPYVLMFHAPVSFSEAYKVHGYEGQSTGPHETKLLLECDYPVPESGRPDLMMTTHGQDGVRLVLQWTHKGDELEARERLLEKILQHPRAQLVDADVQEGLQWGYVTVVLNFACKATPDDVEKWVLGELEKMEKTMRPQVKRTQKADGSVTLRLDQGDPFISTLSIVRSSDPRTPLSSRYVWRIQRRAPWLYEWTL